MYFSLAGQIIAMQLLQSGYYDTIILGGADTVNPFVLKGLTPSKP